MINIIEARDTCDDDIEDIDGICEETDKWIAEMETAIEEDIDEEDREGFPSRPPF